MAEAARSLGADRVGGYKVLAKLGAGGMGVVYKALDLKLQRTVALKFLAQEELQSDDKRRLLHEARAASILDHVNIATVHAVEEAPDGRLFMVTGYYEGETLADKIRRGTLQLPQALDIACQIARGLDHAHAHGIIHRDIKPSNVIVTSDGVAKIVDFGLARHSSLAESTASLNLSGTFFYMSPEQAKGQALDARTDVWSLGVLLYQMVTGRLPFEAPTPAAILLAIISSPPAPIIEVPDELQIVIFRALSKSRDARYASCAEMLQDLQKLRANPPLASVDRGELRKVQHAAQAEPVPGQWRRAVWPLWAALLVVVVALVTGATLYWRNASRRQAIRTTAAPSAPPAETLPVAYESYLKGREYLQRYDKTDNLDHAITLFESAVKADPGFALGYAALGEAYWDKYRLDQNQQWLQHAEAYCKRALKLDDQLPAVHITLGRIHSGSDKQLALQEFQRALKLDPRNADALLGLAVVYDRLDRPREAENTFQQAVALRPDYWGGYYAMGSFYFDRRQFDKAAQQWRRVVELTPDNARAHSSLGVALQELGRFDEAEAALKKSLEVKPNYAAYTMLGRLYYQQKRWAEAAAMVEEGLKLNHTDYRVWATLGLAYEWLHEQDKAKQAYQEELARLEEALKLSPEDATLQSELGLLYSKQRLRQKALQRTQAALARAPNDPRVLSNAGEAYENLGDRTRALGLIQKALAKGWTMGQLERNPGLQNLLADPRFRRMTTDTGAVAHR